MDLIRVIPKRNNNYIIIIIISPSTATGSVALLFARVNV